MAESRFDAELATILQEIVGYLNFSSGASDPQFLKALDRLWRHIEEPGTESNAAATTARKLIAVRLDELAGGPGAFSDVEQARAVLALAFDHTLKAYRTFHVDLLFHETDAALWRPLFVGRVCEAVLREGGPWDETDRIAAGAVSRLNDFLGHRPVATLRTSQRLEPYAHEWIRPIPLYVAGVGLAPGRYERLLETTLAILRATDPALLVESWFDPALLDELALDPRTYDFDHPVNKRPNYHFGQWDPHHLDNQGRYRRFVLQKMTLDALVSRATESSDLPPDELLFEAAAVLAGTILMASGTSGNGPDAHPSTTTLSTLVQQIAAYRDAFYQQLLERAPGAMGDRMRRESTANRQPLSATRQYLNHYLARRRAAQLEHVHLALLFAQIGYPEAAQRQAQIVPTASARLRCEIECRLSGGHHAVESGQLEPAAALLRESEDLLHRGIECGALVDPWNILGFQGQFSLFPAPENSVPDHRVEQFIELLQRICGLYARLWSEAAARDRQDVAAGVDKALATLTRWWDQFAATTVEGVGAFSGAETYESARQVALALEAWHRAGAAAADVAFWRKRVEQFRSPKAYALVVEALLEKRDFIAAMALLMQWLNEAGSLALEQGEYSFHMLARRWLTKVCTDDESPPDGVAAASHARQALVQKFFDYLEANADELGQVPRLENESSAATPAAPADETDEEGQLYDAAYDDVVYVDSTGDGIESDMLEAEGGSRSTHYELEHESRRLRERLALVGTLGSLWKRAALACQHQQTPLAPELLQRWLAEAEENQRRLAELLVAVQRRKIATPGASREALIDYDRQRSIKESLLESTIATAVETADATRLLRGLQTADAADSSRPIDATLRAVLNADPAGVRRGWQALAEAVGREPLLYVALGRGGDPRKIVAVRSLQQLMRDLARWLPRLGLLTESCQLVEIGRRMENDHPVGSGAVSEFDRLFETAYKGLVTSIVDVSAAWPVPPGEAAAGQRFADADLIDCLEQLTESLLKQWLAHSRTLRLSVLEKVSDEKSWTTLVSFIETYGHELFTQKFLNLGNLRAILHQGVDAWLARLEEEPDRGDELRLIRDLGGPIKREDAVRQLSLTIEAVAENYGEYRDYNSTTTQSDRGELLHTFLDFLRLRVQYDRIAWHLRPIVLAHEILVRRGRTAAAELWQQAMAERTNEVAETLLRRLNALRKKYGVRLPTVSDRIAERFIRPLAIDRVRALVKPAIDDARAGRASEAFEQLEAETEELTQEPTGVGLDVPVWLEALEAEVRQASDRLGKRPATGDVELAAPQSPLSRAQVSEQLTDWEQTPL